MKKSIIMTMIIAVMLIACMVIPAAAFAEGETEGAAPVITKQPNESYETVKGDESTAITVEIEATGSPVLEYSWQEYQDGEWVSGILKAPVLRCFFPEDYPWEQSVMRCVVTNEFGEAITNEFVINILDAEAEDEESEEDGEQSKEDGEQPEEDGEQSEEDGEQPEEDAEQPEEDAEQPEEDAEQPEEDVKKPEEKPAEPEASEKPKDPNIPKTGDDSAVFVWMMILSAVGICAAVLMRALKKN